jgi:hypothetical protein
MQMVEASEQAAHGLEHAMRLMKDAGFEIRHPVRVVVDPNLPFMGYTMPEENSFKIVTSRMATSSEMLEGLLTHELSHIYRMQTNHPSHNEEIITAAVNKLGKRNLAPEYKMKIIRDLINDLEDLYADDVAVKVMTENGVISKDQLAEFFQSWVKGEPVRSRFAERDGWVNASIMAKNARAISQMIRHGIVDRNGKARTGQIDKRRNAA